MNIWFVVFFLTPLLEIYVLISVGGWVGVVPTVFMVMFTAILGVTLLRQQGISTLTRGMQKLHSGELPARELAEGMLLAIAGALLLTPGFVTDAVGFVLLTPVLRAGIVERLEKKIAVMPQPARANGRAGMRTGPGISPEYDPNSGHTTANSGSTGQTIEGEFERRP